LADEVRCYWIDNHLHYDDGPRRLIRVTFEGVRQ
jgi:hypothetical protein